MMAHIQGVSLPCSRLRLQRQIRALHCAWRCLPVCSIALALSACATLPQSPPDVPPLTGHPRLEIADVDLLRLTPEMRAFTALHTTRDTADSGKAWMLAYAALDPYLFHFEYDPMVTLTADEAFRSGRGNCLSFSGMFVAMAREAGLKAWFQEVIVPPEWNAVNEVLLVSKHVNAVVAEGRGRYVIDVSRREKQSLEATRRMSDDEALAQYYNNLGAEALVDHDLRQAHAYFSKALETHPGLPYVWSNLGVVLNRNGQTADAILAYRTAIDIDGEHTVALNNLYSLYTETGDLQAAAAIQQQVERNRRNNPYYLHYLGEVANEEQRWPDAIALLNRAIGIEANEYRFHYTLAQAYNASGNLEEADASLERARQLAPAGLEQEALTLP